MRYTYTDIVFYLPDLSKRLKSFDTAICGCNLLEPVIPGRIVCTLFISYFYPKPTGFRSINILDFRIDGTVTINNKISIQVIEICILWSYTIKSEKDRVMERTAIFKNELIETIWHPNHILDLLDLRVFL